MFETKDLKIQFKIEDELITFDSFNEYVWLINDFLSSLSKSLNRKTKSKEEKRWLKNNPPRIISIGNGCIWIDVVIPIVCALIPVVYDIVKNLIDSYKSKYISSNLNSSTITLKGLFCKGKKDWDINDEILFVKKTINTYVKRMKNTDIDTFVDHLPKQLKKYGRNSLICKVHNTKAVFNFLNVSNSLQAEELSHYSKRHLKLTADALKILLP